MSLKLSKAYCCEHVPCFKDREPEATRAWNKAFGRRKWASVTEVVRACDHFALSRHAIWAHYVIRAVLRTLRDTSSLETYAAEDAYQEWRAQRRRWAKKIDAEWSGTLDYC